MKKESWNLIKFSDLEKKWMFHNTWNFNAVHSKQALNKMVSALRRTQQ